MDMHEIDLGNPRRQRPGERERGGEDARRMLTEIANLDAITPHGLTRWRRLAWVEGAVSRIDRHLVAEAGDGTGHADRRLGRAAGALGKRGDDVQDADCRASVERAPANLPDAGAGRKPGCC